MTENILKIGGFGTIKYKEMDNAELLTTLEELTAECQRNPRNYGRGYVRNIIRQEVLSRMKNDTRR